MDVIQKLEIILARVQDWIKVVDQKASILATSLWVILTLLWEKLLKWYLNLIKDCASYSAIFGTIGILFILIWIWLCLSIIIPKIRRTKKKNSVSYFWDIAWIRLQDYKSLITSLDDQKYQDDLTEQIHVSSVIAKQKHIRLELSIGSIILWTIVLSIVHILKINS